MTNKHSNSRKFTNLFEQALEVVSLYWPEFISIGSSLAFFCFRISIPEEHRLAATIAWLSAQVALLGIMWKKAAKDRVTEIKTSLSDYNEIPQLISAISDSRCKNMADRRHKQIIEELQDLRTGKITLRRDESIDYQTELVLNAKKTINTIHVVNEEEDLVKWLKKNNFSKLTAAMKASKVHSKKRLYLINESLPLKSLKTELESISKLNLEMKFDAKVLRVPTSMINSSSDGNNVPSFLYVDKAVLVVAEIAKTSPRRWEMKAFVKELLDEEPLKSELNNWLQMFNRNDAVRLSEFASDIDK